MEPKNYAQALKGRGLRVTSTRLATLQVLEKFPHSSADRVIDQVRQKLGTASRQAVYDILHTLEDVGLVRHIDLGGRASLYEMCEGDNHHHFVCEQCGAIEDVPCQVGSAPCMLPPDGHHLHVDAAEVIYRGLCHQCQSAQT